MPAPTSPTVLSTADDIFQFLDRKLAQRFIISPPDVARRIDAFDMVADIDGRYRVNECYCHDTTWQDALQALVRSSDVGADGSTGIPGAQRWLSI